MEIGRNNHDNEVPAIPRPWGLAGTLIFSALIVAGVVFTQLVYLFYRIDLLRQAGEGGAQLSIEKSAEKMAASGDYFAAATILQAVIVVVLIVLFVAMKKGITIREYLGLYGVSARALILWAIAALIVASLGDLITYLFGYPLVPRVFAEMHKTTSYAPMFWLAVIIAAPLAEEAFFRGFLFEGLRHSTVGPVGAVLTTSILWGALHVQYEYYLMAVIVLIGLLLGYVKLKTNSLNLVIFMHFAVNLMAMVQMELYFAYVQPV